MYDHKVIKIYFSNKGILVLSKHSTKADAIISNKP